MSSPNTVSIVVASYGRFNHVKKLVESARATFPPDVYEIVAVCSDNPYSDKAKWLVNQRDVRYLQADIRSTHRLRSLYYYENLGIKAAKNEWILDFNDDITFRPDFYSQMVKVCQDYDVILVNEHIGEVGLGPRIPAIGKIWTPASPDPNPLYLYDAPILRKSTFEKIGFLDENLDWFGKGFDLAMTVEFTAGARILRQSDLFLDHAITSEGRCPPHYGPDFTYATNKWKTWCLLHPGYKFEWPW